MLTVYEGHKKNSLQNLIILMAATHGLLYLCMLPFIFPAAVGLFCDIFQFLANVVQIPLLLPQKAHLPRSLGMAFG